MTLRSRYKAYITLWLVLLLASGASGQLDSDSRRLTREDLDWLSE